MSFISSLFFILLLCLSMHACNARLYGIVNQQDLQTHELHLTSRVGGKVKHKKDTVRTREDNINDHKIDVGAITKEPENQSKAISKGSGDRAPIKSLIKVSWPVPQANRHEHPGFQSDYSLPRTRTPSHN